MSGGCTVRFLLIVACALATFAHCARALEDEEFSAVLVRLLKTSPEAPANQLAPPQLPSALHTGNKLEVNGQPATTAKEDKVKNKPTYDVKSNEDSSRASAGVGLDSSDHDHDQELQRPKWMRSYFNMLHLTPSGANPIGNHGRVPPHASTTHVVKKSHRLLQDHMVNSKTMYDSESHEENSKASPIVRVDASADDRDQELESPERMRGYFNMRHLTPSGANPIGNGQTPHASTTHVATKDRYPPHDHGIESGTMYAGKSSKASPDGKVDENANEQPLQHPKYMYNYNSMLHKTPSGPNPIGNEYGSASARHNVKKHCYPPPEHRVKSKSMYDGKSNRKSVKASPGVTVDASADDQQFQGRKDMYRYYSMLHKTPSGPNPIGNEYRPTNPNVDVKKYRYPPQG